jgi:hypothetical protein
MVRLFAFGSMEKSIFFLLFFFFDRPTFHNLNCEEQHAEIQFIVYSTTSQSNLQKPDPLTAL